MKPWENQKTVEFFRRAKGWYKVHLAIEMADLQYQLLEAGLMKRLPRMSRRRLEKEIVSCLWPEGLGQGIKRSSRK